MQKLITIKHYFLYNVSRKGIAVFFQQKRTESFVYYRQLRKISPPPQILKKMYCTFRGFLLLDNFNRKIISASIFSH